MRIITAFSQNAGYVLFSEKGITHAIVGLSGKIGNYVNGEKFLLTAGELHLHANIILIGELPAFLNFITAHSLQLNHKDIFSKFMAYA